MAIPKRLCFGVILLVMFYSLDRKGFRQSVSFFQELMDSKSSSFHVRNKRDVSTNATDYEFQVVISISDLDRLYAILNNLTLPIPINDTQITNIEVTTVCTSNMTKYQCICEENFAWSYNNCITYRACDTIISDTCRCISDLPADGHFCQQNTSQIVTLTSAATPTTGMK
ncbi:adhesion G protein-coupled receptor F5-like [Nothobranchius furzeri]|uniref:Adhesion G protein-coupled receptor F5-like n=1 Tax=Nothobranchius furzeri TaxID=105023 RepID=A0A9D3C1Z9_NOTFU|nr:adhesion G protein-coupled receptor F5-like [Nothobranchius furzeri]